MNRHLQASDLSQQPIVMVGTHLRAVAFASWKRQTELVRGSLFGKRRPLSGHLPQIQLLAEQLMRQTQEPLFLQDNKTSEVPIMPLTLTLPPIKRIIRKSGHWWAWVVTATTPDNPYPHPKWRKVPNHLNEILESTTKDMHPQLVAANFHRCQSRGLTPPQTEQLVSDWQRISGKLNVWNRRTRLEVTARQYHQMTSNRE